MRFKHILFCAFSHDSFSLCWLHFCNSCTSGIFYLVPPSVMSFFLYKSSFLDSCTLGTFFLVLPTVTGFLLRRLDFPDYVSWAHSVLCLSPWWVSYYAGWFFFYQHTSCISYLMPPSMMNFFLHGSSFPDSCILSTLSYASPYDKFFYDFRDSLCT